MHYAVVKDGDEGVCLLGIVDNAQEAIAMAELEPLSREEYVVVFDATGKEVFVKEG